MDREAHFEIWNSSSLFICNSSSFPKSPRFVKMPGRLEGLIALVSGSTQGFGRGILETFIREGAVVLGMDLQATDGLVDGYSEQQAYQIKADVAEEQSWKKAVKLSFYKPHMSVTC
jgi:hypothetical protein